MSKSKQIIEVSTIDTVSVFMETAKSSGRLVYDPHEAYNSEIEERGNRKAD